MGYSSSVHDGWLLDEYGIMISISCLLLSGVSLLKGWTLLVLENIDRRLCLKRFHLLIE